MKFTSPLPRLLLTGLVPCAMLGFSMHAAPSAHAADAPRKIEVTAKRFEFSPAEITVKKGEPVVLVLHSEDVTHGIRVSELKYLCGNREGKQCGDSIHSNTGG